MVSEPVLDYVIKDPLELNLSYMPFIEKGGLFIPTMESYSLGDRVVVNLVLPARKDSLRIEGKVIWITPPNALHHVLPGIGIQFIGSDAKTICTEIESNLDVSPNSKMALGGYTYGITETGKT